MYAKIHPAMSESMAASTKVSGIAPGAMAIGMRDGSEVGVVATTARGSSQMSHMLEQSTSLEFPLTRSAWSPFGSEAYFRKRRLPETIRETNPRISKQRTKKPRPRIKHQTSPGNLETKETPSPVASEKDCRRHLQTM